MNTDRSYSILYIEDNAANRQLVELILERKQHLNLDCASTGKSGIQLAKDIVPDLILLDISLPDMNGYHVLTAIRAIPEIASTPVIIISGDIDPEIPPGLNSSAEKYLPKPIEIAPLYAAIDELLGLQ